MIDYLAARGILPMLVFCTVLASVVCVGAFDDVPGLVLTGDR